MEAEVYIETFQQLLFQYLFQAHNNWCGGMGGGGRGGQGRGGRGGGAGGGAGGCGGGAGGCAGGAGGRGGGRVQGTILALLGAVIW